MNTLSSIVYPVITRLSMPGLDNAQRVKLMAFTESTILEAKKIYERQRLTPRNPFAFFFSICKRLAAENNEPLDWTRVDFIKDAYSITDSRKPAVSGEALRRLISSQQISTDTEEIKANSSLCPQCKNKPSVCICGSRTKEEGCICYKEPNRKCRGYARAGSSHFHIKAAYEHFEKFKNPKGLAFLGYSEDYNPFKEEYNQWKTDRVRRSSSGAKTDRVMK